MSIELEIKNAFDEALAKEKTEDQIKMAMMVAGATFKSVPRLYNKFLIDSGIKISKKDRDAKLDNALQSYPIHTEQGFKDAIASVMNAIPNTTAISANSLIRHWAKRNDMEAFKVDTTPKPTFIQRYYAFLLASPRCTEEDATAFIMGTGGNEETSKNVRHNLSRHLQVRQLVIDVLSQA